MTSLLVYAGLMVIGVASMTLGAAVLGTVCAVAALLIAYREELAALLRPFEAKTDAPAEPQPSRRAG